MVRRFDASTIKARRDAAGMLRGVANLTRTGVLVYRNADGTERRELRHPDEVFREGSLATLSLTPMTLGHPAEAVTSKSPKGSIIGAIGETVKADGKFVRAPFLIHDDAAIGEIESGRQRELSCGYNCDLDMTPGTFEGERYDAVQRNIEYNHVAVLPKGRAGPEVRIDGDAIAATIFEDAQDAPRAQRMDTVKTIRLDGVDYDVSSPAFDQAWAKYTAAQDNKIAILEKSANEAKADADKQRGRADAAEAQIVDLKKTSTPEAVAAHVKARVALESQAAKIMGAKFSCDGKTDDEIRRACVLKASPSAKLDGQSDAYVSARFDHVAENFKPNAATDSRGNNLRADLDALDHEDNADADDLLNDTKQQAAMAERNRNAWKPAIAK